MLVDFHTHIYSPDLCARRDPFLEDRNFSCLYTDPCAKLIHHEELLATMDRLGIDYAVALGFPWTGGDFAAGQNDYLLRSRDLARGRIIPFASIPAGASKEEVRRLVREAKSAGFAGIGEVGFYTEGLTGTNLGFLGNILEAAQEEGLPVNLHVNEPVGHAYPGKYHTGFAELYALITRFPGAVIILSHWGGGFLFYELMPEVARACVNVHYDCAASPYLYSPTIYPVACTIAGREKILFGSDYPLLGPERYLRELAANLESGAIADITGGNAARLLSLQERS